jgi:hypothetical protein
MNRLGKTSLFLVLMVAFAAAVVAAPQAASAEQKSVDGELVKVDAASKMLTIKNQEGQELQFAYDDSTQVEGQEGGVQGLASSTGTRLTVHYKEDSGKMHATRIQIKKQG